MRFPDIPDSPDIRAFHWDFQAYDTDRGTFEGFVVGQDGGGLHGSSEYLVRLSRNIQYNLAR